MSLILNLNREHKEELKEELKEHKKELLNLTESKNESFLSLKNEFNEAKNLAETRAQHLLQTEHIVNIRGALKFVCAQILKKDKSIVFTEPVDKALMRLFQDEDFKESV
ncbi:25975_t:CDS:2 [Dentiscutata erythropus]|uniref:25975_t:CDS:1 n=1 Tax=Dentiscutata erythropus TaxID=1348616 RepID=A0A9N9ISL0_9GLOM|nr:25975_t:CDS:2 [Dentiscutata erythropus]